MSIRWGQGQRVSALLLAAAGLIGAAWAAHPGVDGPASNAEALAGNGMGERSAPGAWIQKMLGELGRCSCAEETGPLANNSLLTIPGCFVKKLFDPCAYDGVGAVGLVILAVFFAVLTRQTALGYRRNWRLSFALFLVLFLGTTIFDAFVLAPEASILEVEFVTIFFASAFFGGVLAFWTTYLLDLLAVAAGVSLVTLLAHFIPLPGLWMPVVVAAGIVGGAWLHWWRDLRENPKVPASGQTPQTR